MKISSKETEHKSDIKRIVTHFDETVAELESEIKECKEELK